MMQRNSLYYMLLVVALGLACVGCPSGEHPAIGFSTGARIGDAPLTITFTADATPDTLEITSYEWDFGDGQTSTEAQPQHVYANPGLYDVTLTAKTKTQNSKGGEDKLFGNKTYTSTRESYIVALNPDREQGETLGEIKTFQGIDFVWIPGGTFTMGSTQDTYWDSDARPQHPVDITRGFWMSQTEITQVQWTNVMGYNPSFFAMPDHDVSLPFDVPVEQVSWGDCEDFCKALTAADGQGLYRLPTEAEWEFACRAGTTTQYWFGEDAYVEGDGLRVHGWYWDNARYRTMSCRTEGHMNPWGLYEMHGNVYEWCFDFYDDPQTPDESYYQACADQTTQTGQPVADPEGPATGFRYVVRGGSWDQPAHVATSVSRLGFMDATRYKNIGFRVVRN